MMPLQRTCLPQAINIPRRDRRIPTTRDGTDADGYGLMYAGINGGVAWKTVYAQLFGFTKQSSIVRQSGGPHTAIGMNDGFHIQSRVAMSSKKSGAPPVKTFHTWRWGDSLLVWIRLNLPDKMTFTQRVARHHQRVSDYRIKQFHRTKLNQTTHQWCNSHRM